MSEIKVNSIKGVGASAAAVTVHNSDGTCTLASGSKLNNCTTDGTTNLTIADGNLVVGTSGHGIDFSAQAAAGGGTSMSAELLDHYEEGSWSPAISSGGTDFTINSSGCQYTRVGALVFICFDITQSNGGPITQIFDLPFAVFKHSTFSFGFVTNSSGNTQGSTDITGGRIDFGNNLTLAPAGGSSSQQLASGQRVIGSGCYITDA